MPTFGLIGYPLSHSFSPDYFSRKFNELGLEQDHDYHLFPLPHLSQLSALLDTYPDLRGLNVTIPYKQDIIPYLDWVDREALRVGAVNTILVTGARKLHGYNTDIIGFGEGLQQLLARRPVRGRELKALVLGTGGAARAVCHVLDGRGIDCQLVSRMPGENRITYRDLDGALLQQYQLIINTTPLGMHPATDTAPELPYKQLTSDHLLYDLVYNPQETLFLARGRRQGAATQNGLSMLYGQAEAAWQIWTQKAI